jgi:hypothetical protein
MPSPPSRRMRIGRLRLRVEAAGADAGRAYAGELVRRLADDLRDAREGRFGHLRLRLSPETAEAGNAASVSSAVARRLNGGSDG